MTRICSTLAAAGYEVTLTGTKGKNAPLLIPKPYKQKRLFTLFNKGFGFYAGYNTLLFFYLLFKKTDIICCIDLDTMLPVWLAAKLRNKRMAYDAHEYFSQQKEIISRPVVYKVWNWIERNFVPRFKNGYTVSHSIASAFKNRYGVNYEVIRNVSSFKSLLPDSRQNSKTILYQGAVNEARGLEFLIPAMKHIDAVLNIYGDGNFLQQTKNLIAVNNLQDKVFLKGKLLPEELDSITQSAYIGINLVENNGLNQYYSLANKFFDYMQHGLPQVSMNYPEYKMINDEYEIALLIGDLDPLTIADAIKRLLTDKKFYQQLSENCLKAREILNWENEEKKLLDFYKRIS